MCTERVDVAHRADIRAHREFLAAVAEHETSETWRRDGAANYAAWLAGRYQETYPTARQWVSDAHALAERPALDEAFKDGQISTAQMRAISTLADPGTDHDELWLEAIEGPEWDILHLQREAAKKKAREREQTNQGIYLGIKPTHNEKYMDLRGRFTYDDGAMLISALDSRIPHDAPLNSYDRLCAQALISLVKTAATGDGRATLVVHVEATDTIGTLQGGGCLSPEAVERLACDARVQPVFKDNGQPVGVGRARRVCPPWLQRLVWDRDQSCVFPGCGRKAYIDIHHIRHWLKGGPTDLPNVLLCCDFHHRLLHEHGWKLEGDAGPDITWIRPDGKRLRRGSALIDSS